MGKNELQATVPFDSDSFLHGVLNPERGERIIVDRMEPVDVNRIRGLQTILRMFKENRDHLEGITDETTVFDLNKYYTEPGRHGFVGISDKKGLVGVYDLKGPEITTTTRGNRDVTLTVGFLNRMCVRNDLQRKGVGEQLTKDVLQRAHNEYGWLNVFAGIVLDEKQTQLIQKARAIQDEHTRETIFREVFEGLKLRDEEGGDARVRLFVVRNGFQYAGFHPNVTVGEQVREVLLISHPHPDLTPPKEGVNGEMQIPLAISS